MIRFNEEIAVSYGINAAITAEFIWKLLEDENEAGSTVIKYGSCWVRYSMKKMVLELRCLSLDMVKDAVKVLTDEGIIRKDNFNYSRFDHTNWYSFTEYGEHLMKRSERNDENDL